MLDNNNSSQFGFVDLLGVISTLLGLANYGQNLTQSDKQELLKVAIIGLSAATNEIHEHLKNQDAKIDKIIRLLEDKNNGSQ